ncbi:unnamed protein product [Malus baccata var. baccata]
MNLNIRNKRKKIPKRSNDPSWTASTSKHFPSLPLLRHKVLISEPKKNRSKTRRKNSDKLQEQLGGLKMPITLTKLKGKPTGPNSSFLVNDIGFVVRTYAPLNVKQWRNVEKKDVDKMIERINSKYDIDMSLTHERSNKNAINRSHLTYNHKGGSKSFRAHEEEIEAKTREQLSAIDYFEVVHKNTKNGWDEGAKLKVLPLIRREEMLSMKNETTLPEGMVTLTDDEIVLGVLAHKSGYFKGPLKSVSHEDTMLDKHLKEKLETQ